MAKRKPDQSINLRIELQDYERKALAQAQTAAAVKDFAEAIDKLTSFENFYLLVTLAEIITGKEIIPGTPNDIYQLIDWFREWAPTLDASEIYDTVEEGEDASILDVIFMALKKSTLLGNLV